MRIDESRAVFQSAIRNPQSAIGTPARLQQAALTSSFWHAIYLYNGTRARRQRSPSQSAHIRLTVCAPIVL